MKYMVIERFKKGRVGDVYRRFADKGRMTPEGLHFIESWVSADLTACYQLMETDEVKLFKEWTLHWEDLVDFEIVPIIASAEAKAKALAST